MDRELRDKLWEEFPLLYGDRNDGIRSSLIPFGFECGNGWYDIIYALSQKLEGLIEDWITGQEQLRCRYCGFAENEHNKNGELIGKTIFLPYTVDAGSWSPPIPELKMFERFGLKYYLKAVYKFNRWKVRRHIDRVLYWLYEKMKIGKTSEIVCPGYRPEQPRAFQVKEKYGTLRFYMDLPTDEMFSLIDEAEEQSAHTCEVCGKPGEERYGGWVSTLCDECHELKKA